MNIQEAGHPLEEGFYTEFFWKMTYFNFKTKDFLKTYVKTILHSTDIGKIITREQEHNILCELLYLHYEYETNIPMFFTVSNSGQYKTFRFLWKFDTRND